MNHWTNLSIEFANQKNYLDEQIKNLWEGEKDR